MSKLSRTIMELMVRRPEFYLWPNTLPGDVIPDKPFGFLGLSFLRLKQEVWNG